MGSLRKPDINNVSALYQESTEIIRNVANLWAVSHRTTTTYRMRLPNITTIHVSDGRFQVPTFLLDGIPALAGHLKKLDPFEPLVLPHLNKNFQHVTVWLKLSWLAQLQCACSELDYRLCGITRMVFGMLKIVTSQFLIKPGDSIFTDHANSGGVFLNLNSFMDDLIDGFARKMGVGWDDFLGFCKTCGPYRVCNSKVDIRSPQVHDCQYLQNLIDDIFVAYCLRLPSENRMMDIIEDIGHFELRQPCIPDLDWHLINHWNTSDSRATKNEYLRKAQRQTIHVIANVEMRNTKTFLNGERAEWDHVEKIDPKLFSILLVITSHHDTFPEEWRQRLHDNLPLFYDLTQQQQYDLSISGQVNRDEKLLSNEQILKIKEKCIERLCWLDNNVHTKPCTLPFRIPSMICRDTKTLFVEEEKRASKAHADTSPFYKAHPYRRTFDGGGNSRPDFKVLKGKGAYVFDRKIGRFRLNRVFSEAPLLGSE